MKNKPTIFQGIKNFLVNNADSIQKKATEQHKELLGGNKFRTEIIEKYQRYHIRVVEEVAHHLDIIDTRKSSAVFKSLGETLANQAVQDTLTIEETTDGIIFLKQSIWESLEKEGFLKKLSIEEFYKITQTSGIFIDIVVSKIAFTYHRHFRERKDKQEKQKNELIGLISHELKTPVTSIKAFAQVLQYRFAKAGDMQSSTLLLKMDAQLDKLSALITDVIDVTKIETGKLQFHKKFFDFNEVVHEIVEEMQRTTQKHTIVVKAGKTKFIHGDRDRIGQVLVNLLTNAIKYSPRGGDIAITTEPGKDTITLCVQDFGVGIPKNHSRKYLTNFTVWLGKMKKRFPVWVSAYSSVLK